MQVMRTSSAFLNFLEHSVAPLANVAMGRGVRLATALEEPPSSWPEMTAAALLLKGRAMRWMQGQGEEGAGREGWDWAWGR